MTEDFIKRYTSDICSVLRQIDPGPILAAVTALHKAWKAEKPVLFCGNGGSGASCSHIVNDFQKGISVHPGRQFKALCLNDCMPLVSAYANDMSWIEAYAPQVATWAEEGAVLVALSGSGNSKNILNAIATANACDMTTVGLSGYDGGKLKHLAYISIHVPTQSMQHAEDAHVVILHMLYLGLAERILADVGGG